MAQNQNIGLFGQYLTVNAAANSIILAANGYNGSAGQVLTSNATGGLYWGAGGGGGGTGYAGSVGYVGSIGVGYTGSSGGGGGSWNGGPLSNTVQFTNTTISTNAVSGAVTIVGGLGVNNNIYTAGRVGFSNSTNISVAYVYYNSATDSIDTVFG